MRLQPITGVPGRILTAKQDKSLSECAVTVIDAIPEEQISSQLLCALGSRAVSDASNEDEAGKGFFSASVARMLESDKWPSETSEESETSSGKSNAGAAASYEERMERWQRRKEQRQKKKASFGVSYGQMVRASASSNHKSSSLADTLEERGLLISKLEPLATGSFARVYKGVWCRQGRGDEQPMDVAVKCIRCSQSGDTSVPVHIGREAWVGKNMRHKNLVQLFEVSIDKLPFMFVMEYCRGGSVHSLLHARHPSTAGAADALVDLAVLTWQQRVKVALDVAVGMAYLHANEVIHRDIKSQNIMLDAVVDSPAAVPLCKIGDFGLAKYMGGSNVGLTLNVGSFLYMAPEVFQTNSDDCSSYSRKADVYSFSMLIYELLTDKMPFSGTQVDGSGMRFVLHVINYGVRPNMAFVPMDAPEVVRELMQISWQADPVKRPSFLELSEQLGEAYAHHDETSHRAASNDELSKFEQVVSKFDDKENMPKLGEVLMAHRNGHELPRSFSFNDVIKAASSYADCSFSCLRLREMFHRHGNKLTESLVSQAEAGT